LEELFAAWAGVSRQIGEAGHVLLLTDYDGTLTPIADRPELADLPEDMKRLLQELAGQSRFTVGVVSGRSLVSIKRR
jgi:trehalose-phosphatase